MVMGKKLVVRPNRSASGLQNSSTSPSIASPSSSVSVSSVPLPKAINPSSSHSPSNELRNEVGQVVESLSGEGMDSVTASIGAEHESSSSIKKTYLRPISKMRVPSALLRRLQSQRGTVAAVNGTGFPVTEHDRLDLRGLLPPNVMTSEQQIERIMADLKRLQLSARDGPSDPYNLAKWRRPNRLHNRNETMYYKVLRSDHMETID